MLTFHTLCRSDQIHLGKKPVRKKPSFQIELENFSKSV